MQTLFSNTENIIEIKRKVDELSNSLFYHYNYPNIPIYDDSISIVMTSSNRSKQVYYTLDTIKKCSFKHIQLIIIDDSDIDPIEKNKLKNYPFYIDFICIGAEQKNWVNPCVNYNIGFKFIKGSKVIIQNAEVCYIGDILKFVSENLLDNNYYSFDVRAIKSIEYNELIYNINELTTDIYLNNDIFKDEDSWYQGRKRISNYHFLTAMTTNTFKMINNFSYDYTLGKDWDDNDFLLKIISKNINIINLFNDIYNLGGIHLYHTSHYPKWKNNESNEDIFNKKLEEYNSKKNYIDFIEKINLNSINSINFYITNKTNLLNLQNDILNLNSANIFLIFDKNEITKEINTFRKCIQKGYCYKNSGIKISSNIIIIFK